MLWDKHYYIYLSYRQEIQEDPCVNENFSIYSTFHGYTVHKAYDGGMEILIKYKYIIIEGQWITIYYIQKDKIIYQSSK